MFLGFDLYPINFTDAKWSRPDVHTSKTNLPHLQIWLQNKPGKSLTIRVMALIRTELHRSKQQATTKIEPELLLFNSNPHNQMGNNRQPRQLQHPEGEEWAYTPDGWLSPECQSWASKVQREVTEHKVETYLSYKCMTRANKMNKRQILNSWNTARTREYLTFGSKETSKKYRHTDTEKGLARLDSQIRAKWSVDGKLQFAVPCTQPLHFRGQEYVCIRISLLPFAEEENSSRIRRM